MKSKQFLLFLMCALGALSVTTAHAQASMDHSKKGGMQMAKPDAKMNAAPMSEGEVQKIDIKAQTITLKHGPLANLEMPGMTMAFKVKTVALLAKVKVGDKVKFDAEMPGGTLTLVSIERAQ